MELDDAGERANRLVEAWIVRRYRSDGDNAHLKACADMAVEVDGSDGSYGCDTGCDYARLDAILTCPHGERDDHYTYGELGNLADLLEEIDTEMGAERTED